MTPLTVHADLLLGPRVIAPSPHPRRDSRALQDAASPPPAPHVASDRCGAQALV